MTIIGQYEIRELLGAGGIGQVHAAFDTILEREVAIKSLRPELLNDRNFVDRFRGEATSSPSSPIPTSPRSTIFCPMAAIYILLWNAFAAKR